MSELGASGIGCLSGCKAKRRGSPARLAMDSSTPSITARIYLLRGRVRGGHRLRDLRRTKFYGSRKSLSYLASKKREAVSIEMGIVSGRRILLIHIVQINLDKMNNDT